jgi:hypothetical protein
MTTLSTAGGGGPLQRAGGGLVILGFPSSPSALRRGTLNGGVKFLSDKNASGAEKENELLEKLEKISNATAMSRRSRLS